MLISAIFSVVLNGNDAQNGDDDDDDNDCTVFRRQVHESFDEEVYYAAVLSYEQVDVFPVYDVTVHQYLYVMLVLKVVGMYEFCDHLKQQQQQQLNHEQLIQYYAMYLLDCGHDGHKQPQRKLRVTDDVLMCH